ncbi:hypothetical protein H0H92_004319 [Tricholoma furcatifolium]|nr:hypothetical protein H0H92_004319 [Tricholoma furcatifolium]
MEQLPLPKRLRRSSRDDDSDDDEPLKKRWYHYLPLSGTIFLILMPHPSLLYVLVTHYIQTLHDYLSFATHLLVTYILTFMAFSSLIICIVRDPGPVTETKHSENEETSLSEALMPDIDFDAPGRWCRKCWVSFEDLFKQGMQLMHILGTQA